jgi:hypothetical protein
MSKTSHFSKFSPRIRFNWGYHDGANEAKRERIRNVAGHYDKVYAQGYRYGVEDQTAGVYQGNSDKAWTERASLNAAPWMPARKAS